MHKSIRQQLGPTKRHAIIHNKLSAVSLPQICIEARARTLGGIVVAHSCYDKSPVQGFCFHDYFARAKLTP
jgi:hypothetical protein